nr:MAG TPA: Terminase small subunit [Caudoviricetes sp.]
MKRNYCKDEKRLTECERVFVLQMAQHGDATKAVHTIYAHLSDQAARVVANGLMKRRDIVKHVEFLKKRYEEINRYVEQI